MRLRSAQRLAAEELAASVAEEPRERRAAAPPPRPASAADVLRIPHDVVNEIVLIAAAVVSAEARSKLAKILPADGFYGKGHAAAWAVLAELDRKGLAYDPATVRTIAEESVAAYLETVAEDRPAVPANLKHHVERFFWDRSRIEAARGPVAALLEALRDRDADAGRLRALASAVGGAFDRGSALPFLRDREHVRSEMRRRIAERRAHGGSYAYGLPGLDYDEKTGEPRLVPGMEPGKCTLIVGRAGGGKTTFTNQIVVAQARLGRKGLHGAWEQDAEDNLELLAGLSLGLPRTRLRSEEDEERLVAEAERLDEHVRFFELPVEPRTGKRVFNDAVLDTIARHVEGSGCDYAVFDLLRRAFVQTDPQEEERALWEMGRLAKRTRVHFLIVHHIREKDLESLLPTREGIKGTDAWVAVPDTIFGIHRDATVKNVPDDKLLARVLKQRYGRAPMAVEFDHDPRTGLVSGGREVEFERPDERRAGGFGDSFLDGDDGFGAKSGGRNGKRQKR